MIQIVKFFLKIYQALKFVYILFHNKEPTHMFVMPNDHVFF
jgi:hypothetical protein